MTRHSLERDLSPQRLGHIGWIGGGSGAGKTTIAGLLAEEYGLQLYHCDDTQSAHTARSNAVDHPMLAAFLALTMDERWVKRTPEEMVHSFHGFHAEGFHLILEDLLVWWLHGSSVQKIGSFETLMVETRWLFRPNGFNWEV